MARSMQPGRGRPVGSFGTNTSRAIKLRAMVLRKLKHEMEPILEGQIALAKGILVMRKVLVNGKEYEKFYERAPDVKAAQGLIDHAIGRPMQPIEGGGSPLTIVQVVNNLEKGDGD